MTMTNQCTSVASNWVPVVVAQTDASPTTAPTDRSIPPPVITKVMPMETTPITDASRRMVNRLSVLANRSPAVTMPTTHSRTSAITRPRLRISPGGRARRGRSPVTVGATSTGVARAGSPPPPDCVTFAPSFSLMRRSPT